ncbi:hypothetical protein L1987_15187 [Smallanthus sonchifolius]|uniref:Uncharacterized protein n=1 Tax=Smallanthus sonchifolius TaxID=185202 RepID=A0ACB9J722_9ASTR|nr:hypothetical protein L1987_15187 [Smallanthus sonchifolius]
MADIDNPYDKFSTYHNLTAYLTKGKKSDGFDDMIDFLCRSKIYFALTTNPTIYIPHMEDFWSTAVYSTGQGIPKIKAKVDGNNITILEATLRKHLKLQDEGAAISYSKDEYMRTFVSIGYTGNQTEYTIEKALMGPPWKYLCHTLLQCISQKRSGWHQVSSALASAFHDLSKPARIYIMLGHKNNIFQSMRNVSKNFSKVNVPLLSTMLNVQSTPGDSSAIPTDTDPTPSTSHPEQQFASTVATTYTRKRGKRTPSSLASKAQTQPSRPHSESQHSGENIIRESHIIRETPSDVSLLGSGSLPGSVEQPPEHFLSLLNLSVEEPDQDDVPSPTTTISEVLIDLASNTPNPSSSTLKVHSWSYERVDVEEAVTTAGPSNDQEDSDNIVKPSTTATHIEDVSLETPLTERNPVRQETMGDGDEEARPKAPSGSKDSTIVDEDRLKLHNLELTARVAMLEVEVSKLRHQVSMHEAHQCPTLATPSLVSVGTQTDAYLSTDATKKGEMVSMEEDTDSLDDWIQEQVVIQSSLFKLAFVQIHDLPVSDNEAEETSEDRKLVVRVVDEMLNDAEDTEQTNTSFSILPEAAAIISQSITPQLLQTTQKLEFDSILAWGYDGSAERFWIGWEFSGVKELNWNSLNALQVLQLHLTNCINTSSDLSAELTIGRFHDLMEDNLPHFERLIQIAKRVAYPESSAAAEKRLTLRRPDIIRSSLLTNEEICCLRRFLYSFIVKDLDVLGWTSTKSLDHTFLLSNGSSLTINTRNILSLPTDFLYKIFQLRANICNVNSLESQAMIATVRAKLEQVGRITEAVYVSNSDTDTDSASPRVDICTAAYESRSTIKEMLKEVTSPECKSNEANDLPMFTSQIANEAEAEIPIASPSSAIVVSEVEAEASNVNKGKGIMTNEDEERLLKEKREREEKRRRRRREEEEMADIKKTQERKTAILLREQTIQLYARQLDELKRKILVVDQIEEDAALTLQQQEQFNREKEELEKKKKEEAKFRITDSELAKELREEWLKTLVSQGEDADYLEKLSNKEIYRAYMGQQGQLSKKKQAEEEEKAKQQSKKTIAFNKRTHEEKEVQQPSTLLPKPSTPPPKKSKPSHLAPTHQQPPLKKSKPTPKPEDSRDIVDWVYNPQDQRFEIFRGRTERRRSNYISVDEILQLPDSDLGKILELGEAHEPANESGKLLVLAIKHYFNPNKDVIIDIKPLKSHSPFVSWSYNADLDEFTLTDVRKQKMRCSSKTIYKMPNKDIKTLSALPLNNPSKDPRGIEVERIVSHMQKLQQQSD